MAKEAKDKEAVQGKTEPQQVDAATFIRQEVSQAANVVYQQLAAELKKNVTQLDLLGPAYIKAVSQCDDAVKNATNPHLRNTYADLGSVLAAVREAFLGNGLWLLQCPGEMTIKEGRPYIAMQGLMLHSSGQSVGFKMELPGFTLSKSGEVVLNPQTAGSAISYARRYMWAAVAGITQVDDDGDEASYNNGADGPGKVVAAPQSSGDDAEMLKKIAATTSMDELKKLREAAMATKSKKVSDAYMAKRETFQTA